ncbi:MAG: hypothetical protein COA57_04320 [Flavobacteriales bacterium]|nr:MAG: hypothetical protein COA57_04320 [Flavobacteriales bacterium]
MLLFSACEVINPQEEIPSYIHIEKIDLKITDTNTQGSASHNITDAWVFVDDELIGAFELPKTIPILKAGNHTLKVRAGIKNSGATLLRTTYPFFNSYVNDTTFTLFRDSVITITPVVTYNTDDFTWIEDFEDPAISIIELSNTDTILESTQDAAKVFEGTASGVIYLDSAHPIYRGATNDAYNLPKGGKEVYLELDYKTSTLLVVGLIANNPTNVNEEPVIFIFPTDDWNKIYIDLSQQVSIETDALSYRISFTADISNDSEPSAEIYLDNLKLIHK